MPPMLSPDRVGVVRASSSVRPCAAVRAATTCSRRKAVRASDSLRVVGLDHGDSPVCGGLLPCLHPPAAGGQDRSAVALHTVRMRVSAWLTQFLVAAVVFSVIDVLWLSTVATDLYDEQLGALRAESPNVLAAVLVYLVLLAGLVHFVIHPAVAAGSWRRAVGVGAFFGFVVYGVYELHQPGRRRRLAGGAGADRHGVGDVPLGRGRRRDVRRRPAAPRLGPLTLVAGSSPARHRGRSSRAGPDDVPALIRVIGT